MPPRPQRAVQVRDLIPLEDSRYSVGSLVRRWLWGFFRRSRFGQADGYSEFEADGTLTFVGNATVWDDLRTPVTQVRVPAAKAPTWVAAYGTQVLAFSDQAVEGNEEEVYIAYQIPHSYLEGSDIYPHVHWAPETDDDAVGRWGLEYTWTNIDGAIGASATIHVNQAINGGADDHLYTGFAAIDGTGMTISSVFLCRLFRNSSDAADTFDDDMRLLEVDIHYQQDTVGSRQEMIK